jgi:hypothetical protein
VEIDSGSGARVLSFCGCAGGVVQADATLAALPISRGARPVFNTMLVTFAFNVPSNDMLATVEPVSADGATQWAGSLTAWTSWNHVRTAAALMDAVSFTVAFCLARWISESIFGFGQSHEYPGSQCRIASRGIEGAQGLQISKRLKNKYSGTCVDREGQVTIDHNNRPAR